MKAIYGIRIKGSILCEILSAFEDFHPVYQLLDTGILGIEITPRDSEYTLRNVRFPQMISVYLLMARHLRIRHTRDKNRLIQILQQYEFSNSEKDPVIWVHDELTGKPCWFASFADYQVYRQKVQHRNRRHLARNKTIGAAHLTYDSSEFRSITDISQI
jgi:hypothetical protein